MEKLKVYQFQMSYAETKYLSGIHKNWTIIVCAAKLFFSQFISNLKGLSVINWLKLMVLMEFT